MRFYIHFINDEEKSLVFSFDFDYVNPGAVTIDIINKKYIEVHADMNHIDIYDFDPSKEYLKYQDFLVNKVTRKVQIDL
jgi:hypothetical protein